MTDAMINESLLLRIPIFCINTLSTGNCCDNSNMRRLMPLYSPRWNRSDSWLSIAILIAWSASLWLLRERSEKPA